MTGDRTSTTPASRSSSPDRTMATSDVLDLRYPGGKGLAGLQEWICSLLPPHVYFKSAFAGKCGVFRKKTPSLHSTLIDLSRDVARWWRLQLRRGFLSGQSIAVIQGDGILLMERSADDCPETLWYADPPYLPSTRKRLRLYGCEMSEADHRRFLRAAVRMKCPVVISGYHSALYEDYLGGWRVHTRDVITRGRTLATEHVWTNQPAAEASAVGMTYDQLGDCWRERERVSRLVKRWSNDFGRRTPTERRAILLSLLNAESKLALQHR